MFHKKYIVHTLPFMMILILIACQQEGQRQNDPVEPIRSEYELEAPEMDKEDRQLQLAGGSERDVREPNPVSNNVLQKKYPNTLVLR